MRLLRSPHVLEPWFDPVLFTITKPGARNLQVSETRFPILPLHDTFAYVYANDKNRFHEVFLGARAGEHPCSYGEGRVDGTFECRHWRYVAR